MTTQNDIKKDIELRERIEKIKDQAFIFIIVFTFIGAILGIYFTYSWYQSGATATCYGVRNSFNITYVMYNESNVSLLSQRVDKSFKCNESINKTCLKQRQEFILGQYIPQ